MLKSSARIGGSGDFSLAVRNTPRGEMLELALPRTVKASETEAAEIAKCPVIGASLRCGS
jgi:hypothetical protein